MKKRIRIAAIAAAVALAGTITVYAAYDSTTDPIVSLSYLTEVFKPEVKNALKSELKDEIKGELNSELTSSVNSIKGTLTSDLQTGMAAAKDQLSAELEAKLDEDYSATFEAIRKRLDALENVYETVTLEKGQRLTASAACEIVLLSGSATVRSSAADSGIIDCTDGVILYEGQNVSANHKLLVPDNGDGRGLTCTGTAQLLVKGGYSVG